VEPIIIDKEDLVKLKIHMEITSKRLQHSLTWVRQLLTLLELNLHHS